MQAELLMIGTELLIGQIQDTNATYMAQLLAEHGVNLYQKTTVGDNPGRIQAALRDALARSEVVLCSGGLGPTEDDITRECIAAVFDRPLAYRADLYESILTRFRHTRFQITENNKKQATLPEGAIVIENPHGTAPGFILEGAAGVVITMPGVPGELKPMLEERVLPWLRNRFGMAGVLHYRVIKVCGLGESRVDSLIGDLIQDHANPSIGLLASPDAVRIRIAAKAADIPAAEALIAPVAQAIEKRLEGRIMGYNDDTLEEVVGKLLADRGWRIAIGESVSGGAVAQQLSLGAPAQFAGATIWPTTAELGAPLLDRAVDLNARLLLEFSADCALAVLGAPETGPSVAVLETPAGRAHWEVGHYGGRERRQRRMAVICLEQLRRCLVGAEALS